MGSLCWKRAEDGLLNSPENLLPRGLLFEGYKGLEWITAKGYSGMWNG